MGKDYSKEDDFTQDSLRNLGLIDDNVYIATDRIVEHTRKIKRQTKPDASSASDDAASGSIFTDEDFEVVSKLHFVNSKKAVIVERAINERRPSWVQKY